MSEKNNRSFNTVVPNDGSYLGAKAGKALKDKQVAEAFEKAWISQKTLLKDSLVKLYKDKANIGVQWQSYIDWDNSKLIKPSNTPRSKKYQNRIVSSTGIILGYTKRAKYRGRNTRYVYDIMIDLTGSYFANLTLLEQLELIYYLNSNWELKCYRIDVAIDDYSRKLFPVGQIIAAFLRGDNFGFQVIDDSYLDIINNKLIGTVGIGSRFSSLFIRIYTKHKYFVRWETELKRDKAQILFDKLASLTTDKTTDNLPIEVILKTLIDAAVGHIDFRDKSSVTNLKNATKTRTKRLSFWQTTIDKIYSAIEN